MAVMCCIGTGGDGQCTRRATRVVVAGEGEDVGYTPVCSKHVEAAVLIARMEGRRYRVVRLRKVPLRVLRQCPQIR